MLYNVALEISNVFKEEQLIYGNKKDDESAANVIKIGITNIS